MVYACFGSKRPEVQILSPRPQNACWARLTTARFRPPSAPDARFGEELGWSWVVAPPRARSRRRLLTELRVAPEARFRLHSGHANRMRPMAPHGAWRRRCSLSRKLDDARLPLQDRPHPVVVRGRGYVDSRTGGVFVCDAAKDLRHSPPSGPAARGRTAADRRSMHAHRGRASVDPASSGTSATSPNERTAVSHSTSSDRRTLWTPQMKTFVSSRRRRHASSSTSSAPNSSAISQSSSSMYRCFVPPLTSTRASSTGARRTSAAQGVRQWAHSDERGISVQSAAMDRVRASSSRGARSPTHAARTTPATASRGEAETCVRRVRTTSPVDARTSWTPGAGCSCGAGVARAPVRHAGRHSCPGRCPCRGGRIRRSRWPGT